MTSRNPPPPPLPLPGLARRLPPWTSEAFLERCASEGVGAAVPDFSWYEPMFLQKTGSSAEGATTGCGPDTIHGNNNASNTSGGQPSCFPPLREALELDHGGPTTVAMRAIIAAAAAASFDRSKPGRKGDARKRSNRNDNGNSDDDDEEGMNTASSTNGNKDAFVFGGGGGGADARDEETLAIFGRIGRPTSIEDLWHGPSLSARVPPASDYERLLGMTEEQ